MIYDAQNYDILVDTYYRFLDGDELASWDDPDFWEVWPLLLHDAEAD